MHVIAFSDMQLVSSLRRAILELETMSYCMQRLIVECAGATSTYDYTSSMYLFYRYIEGLHEGDVVAAALGAASLASSVKDSVTGR